MTLTETINYIESEWPDILDANSCARWITNRTGILRSLPPDQPEPTIDQLCCFWMRHEHD